jgi:hypothetical protein
MKQTNRQKRKTRTLTTRCNEVTYTLLLFLLNEETLQAFVRRDEIDFNVAQKTRTTCVRCKTSTSYMAR